MNILGLIAGQEEDRSGDVFRFTDSPFGDALDEPFRLIRIAQAGEKAHPDKFDMEVYTDEFIFDSDDSKFYIYMAIED